MHMGQRNVNAWLSNCRGARYAVVCHDGRHLAHGLCLHRTLLTAGTHHGLQALLEHYMPWPVQVGRVASQLIG